MHACVCKKSHLVGGSKAFHFQSVSVKNTQRTTPLTNLKSRSVAIVAM